MRVGEADNPGPVPILISIVNANGDTTPLRLSDVGNRRKGIGASKPIWRQIVTASRTANMVPKARKDPPPREPTHLEQLTKENSGDAEHTSASHTTIQEISSPEEGATQQIENLSQPVPSTRDVQHGMQGATLPVPCQFQQLAAMTLPRLVTALTLQKPMDWTHWETAWEPQHGQRNLRLRMMLSRASDKWRPQPLVVDFPKCGSKWWASGLLPASRQTAELVKEKWAPRCPDLPDQAPVPQGVLDKVFGVSPVSKAVSHLAAGAAGDSLGWTHEMLQVLHSQAGSFPD